MLGQTGLRKLYLLAMMQIETPISFVSKNEPEVPSELVTIMSDAKVSNRKLEMVINVTLASLYRSSR